MSLIAHAAIFTVFVWWFTTGAIIYLDGLPQRTFLASMAVATALLLVAIHGLSVTSGDTSVAGAYWAFTFALLAWGWNEMGFLMGIVTGPRASECPPQVRGVERLAYAVQAVAYHEIAIGVTAIAIAIATADGPNQTGFWTFMLLWVMRFSAKLNVYLGVPNITEEFLPPHLVYLKTYFRKRPMNAVFPISVTATTLLTANLFGQAVVPGATPFEVTSAALLATLAALALIEHWFMVLPIPATALWQWGLTSHVAQASTGEPMPVPVPARPPATAGGMATYDDASLTTGDLVASIRPPVLAAVGSGSGSTIVNFPALTPATHRRRP
jgi:putative photosynthetic complex assembly protein 2